jgi:hypothetical protein
MKFKVILAFALTMLVSTLTYASYSRNFGRDLSLPSQQLLELLSLASPDASSSTAVIASTIGASSATAATVSTGFTDPDVPRALVVCPKATTADVKAGTVTVYGKNYINETISDTFTFTANSPHCKAGTKAFKTVTSASFPGEDSPYGASWSIGTRDVLGLSFCMSGPNVVFANFNHVYEATRATVAYDVDDVENNTIDLNSNLDGSVVEIYFIQNFRCLP